MMESDPGSQGTYTVSLEMANDEPKVDPSPPCNHEIIDTVLENKNSDDSVSIDLENPGFVRVDGKLNGEISSPDHVSAELMYSNPSLVATEENEETRYRLSWHNLSVDAELPPPGCFTRLKARVTESEDQMLTNAKPIKPIIKNVTGAAEPGSLLAIMGASGAGKTTLLNVLSRQNVARLKIGGSILVNNNQIKNKIKSISAYVQQEDLFIGTLTVKEHLTFQALLRMGDSYSRKEKIQRVNEVMQQLGLLKCQNTIIGVPGRIRGISGGENKRLSFASEIITNPKLLFVDEPTSGLDSFMAENVISALQKIASEGRTVLATIHQPSSSVFQMFDRLLLMSEGRTAYLGSTRDAIEFFNNAGYPCPMNFNPADHYVHTLAIIPGIEEECKQKAMAICDKFDQGYKKEMDLNGDNENNHHGVYTDQGCKVGFFEQFRAVLWRSAKASQREPYVSKLRIIQAIMISLIAGLVYLRQDNDQDGATNLNGALFFTIITMSFNSITASLLVFPAELPVFLKEHKLGMYRTDVYFGSKTLAELPWYVLSTFIFGTIVYFMCGFQEEAKEYFIFICVAQLITQCALSFGYFVSAVSPTVQVASAIGPPLMMPFLLFGGFFIKDESIPVYFIWLKYLSWFKYAFEVLQINQWEDFGAIGCENNATTCLKTGMDVLAKNEYNVDNFNTDIGIMIALMLAFRIVAFCVVLIRARRTK